MRALLRRASNRAMARNVKQMVLIAVAVAAVVVGAVIVASGSGRDGQRAGPAHSLSTNMAVAARYLGLTTAQLRKELRRHPNVEAVANETDGKSAAGLVAALVSAHEARLRAPSSSLRQKRLAQLRANANAWVTRQRVPAGGAAELTTAARYLGMPPSAVRRQQDGGRSLAQIADTQAGKSADGLIAAIVGEREQRLDAALAGGTVSEKRRAALESSLRRRVAAEVRRKLPRRRETPSNF
jgi:hypothetical protein